MLELNMLIHKYAIFMPYFLPSFHIKGCIISLMLETSGSSQGLLGKPLKLAAIGLSNRVHQWSEKH